MKNTLSSWIARAKRAATCSRRRDELTHAAAALVVAIFIFRALSDGEKNIRSAEVRTDRRPSPHTSAQEHDADAQKKVAPTTDEKLATHPLPSPGQHLEPSAPQAAWIQAVPVLHRAHQTKVSIATQYANKMVAAIMDPATDEGISEFVDEVHSLGSAARIAADSEEHRRWVKQLYLKHVFPVADVKEALRLQGEQLATALAEVDNAVLVELLSDTEFDPDRLRVGVIDLAMLDSSIDLAVQGVVDDVYVAVGKSTASFAAGAGAGWVGHGVARNAFKDDKGNVSFGDELLAGLIGIGADWVATEFTEEVLQPRTELHNSVVASTWALVQSAGPEGSAREQIIQACGACVFSHKREVALAVIGSLDVDPAWAWQIYLKHEADNQ